MKINNITSLLAVSFLVLDAFLWYLIFSSGAAILLPREYFFDVGNGESALILLPGNIKILVDAGPNDAALSTLEKDLPDDDRYIDLAIISTPIPGDFGGYASLLEHYRVGAIIYNGRSADKNVWQWPDLMKQIGAKHIPLVIVGAGDTIKYKSNIIDTLSPDADFLKSPDINEAALEILANTPPFKTLFAADSDTDGEDVRADILKVPQGDVNYVFTPEFLKAIGPKIAIFGPGTHTNLASSTGMIVLNTQKEGTIEVSADQAGILTVKNGIGCCIIE